jgi:hypothetical protein
MSNLSNYFIWNDKLILNPRDISSKLIVIINRIIAIYISVWSVIITKKITKFYYIISDWIKRINFIHFNKIYMYPSKASFSFAFLSSIDQIYSYIIFCLFVFILLISSNKYLKSLNIIKNMREKIFSVNRFSLLDILNYFYCFRYILSTFIFLFYFINAINGLNIDYKEIQKMIDLLSKDGGFINYMYYKLDIGINFWDDIDINLIGNKSSLSNKIFAVENNNNDNPNNNDNNANQVERSPSPVNIDNMPRYMRPVDDRDSSSEEGDYDYSDDEGEKVPNEKNGYNPEYSERAAKIERLKQERVGIKLDLHDLMVNRNKDVWSLHSKLRNAEIIEETQTIIPENRPKSALKRTWDDRNSESDSDDDKSKIANNQPRIIRTKKARFNNIYDKKDFQELSEVVEKKTKKVFKWMQQYDKKGEMLDDLESNLEGNMNRITKGVNNIDNNKKNDSNN